MSDLDPVTARYVDEVGLDALERQRADRRAGLCPHCWVRPGEPHNLLLCPDRDEATEAAMPGQDEVLF